MQIRRSEHKTVDDIQNDYIVSKEETFEEDPFSELSRHFLEVRDDNTKPDNSIILGSPQPFPYQARADPAAMQRIPVTERGFKFKKHPGVMRPKNVIEIPKMMEKALDIIYRGITKISKSYIYIIYIHEISNILMIDILLFL